jgi:hypothetical protein
VAVVCEAGEYCWVKGFWLAWFVVMGRFPFDRAAGCWMAGFVGGRALGRHGLHVVHVAVVCEDGECCWVEGLQVDVVCRRGAVPFDRAAFCPGWQGSW